MTYTKEGTLAQIFVAFGQGTGKMRVSQEACSALEKRYGDRIDAPLLASWEEVAVQILERMRAIGRTAAIEAALAGRTAISADEVRKAGRRVEKVSATPQCPPDRWEDPQPELAPELDEEEIGLLIETVVRG